MRATAAALHSRPTSCCRSPGSACRAAAAVRPQAHPANKHIAHRAGQHRAVRRLLMSAPQRAKQHRHSHTPDGKASTTDRIFPTHRTGRGHVSHLEGLVLCHDCGNSLQHTPQLSVGTHQVACHQASRLSTGHVTAARTQVRPPRLLLVAVGTASPDRELLRSSSAAQATQSIIHWWVHVVKCAVRWCTPTKAMHRTVTCCDWLAMQHA